MNILYVTPYVPNLIRVRPLQIIRSLVKRGNCVTLLTVWTQAEELDDLRSLEEMGVDVHAFRLPTWRSLTNSLVALPTGRPLQSVYSHQGALSDELARMVRSGRYDVVHVEHLRGAANALSVAKREGDGLAQSETDGSSRVPVVWDSVDCISHLFEQAAQQSSSLKSRMVTRLELGRTRRYEGQLLRRFDHVTVTSPVDRQALLRLADASAARDGKARTLRSEFAERIHVLPNGVDLEYFVPNAARERQTAVALTGKMSYHANATAARYLVEEIMPRVWSTRPDIQAWIVGKDPPKAVQALASNEARVVVTGAVSDMREPLWTTRIAVAPMLYGAGIQNKVMEAMACGTPVVASAQGVSALEALPGRDLWVAEDAESFASAIVQLMDNPQARSEIGAAGRTYVEQFHSWAAITADLERIYGVAIGDASARSREAH